MGRLSRPPGRAAATAARPCWHSRASRSNRPPPPRDWRSAAKATAGCSPGARPPRAGRPTAYVVQRSITRPGSRQVDPPFQTIYEGDALYFSDDEVAHGGVVLRYMVHAVARGRIEVEGTDVRTYETASAPSAFHGVLIWQEVMNLRSTRRDRALELTWFVPTGARQVLIERWPGGPNDHQPRRRDPAGDRRGTPPR